MFLVTKKDQFRYNCLLNEASWFEDNIGKFWWHFVLHYSLSTFADNLIFWCDGNGCDFTNKKRSNLLKLLVCNLGNINYANLHHFQQQMSDDNFDNTATHVHTTLDARRRENHITPIYVVTSKRRKSTFPMNLVLHSQDTLRAIHKFGHYFVNWTHNLNIRTDKKKAWGSTPTGELVWSQHCTNSSENLLS